MAATAENPVSQVSCCESMEDVKFLTDLRELPSKAHIKFYTLLPNVNKVSSSGQKKSEFRDKSAWNESVIRLYLSLMARGKHSENLNYGLTTKTRPNFFFLVF
jgi:hypothetical protein